MILALIRIAKCELAKSTLIWFFTSMGSLVTFDTAHSCRHKGTERAFMICYTTVNFIFMAYTIGIACESFFAILNRAGEWLLALVGKFMTIAVGRLVERLITTIFTAWIWLLFFEGGFMTLFKNLERLFRGEGTITTRLWAGAPGSFYYMLHVLIIGGSIIVSLEASQIIEIYQSERGGCLRQLVHCMARMSGHEECHYNY
jgi:hypothetical protein